MNNIPKALNRYLLSDFSILQKARFFYTLLFGTMLLIGVILLYTIYLQLQNPVYEGHLFFPVLIAEVVVFLVVLLCYYLLIKGYFDLSAHLFLTASIFIVWFIVWMDRGDVLSRYDTVLYVPAVLSIIPILLRNDKPLIFLYVIINILVCSIYMFGLHANNQMNIETRIDFLADFSISLIFISIVSYSITRINKRINEKIRSEFNEKSFVQKALQESENKYKELSDLLPQVIWEVDLKGQFTYTNKKGFDLFEYSEDDIKKGLSIFDVVVKDEHAKVKANIDELLKGSHNEGDEYTGISKSGKTFPIRLYTSLIYKDEIIVGLRGITIDISEQKLNEQKIQETEGRYKALMESMNEVIIVADNEHKVEFVNQQFTSKLGYRKEEIIGKIGYKILHDPEDLLKVEHANTLRISNKNSVYELKFKAKDGTKYDFLVSGAPYKNAQGETIGSIGAMMDITERKETENKLIEREQQYRTLFENAQIGIYQSTPEGKILNVNPAILKMIGLKTVEELTQRDLSSGEFHVGSERQKFLELIDKNGFVKNLESEWKNIEGETIYVIENAKAVKDKNGTVLYYDGFVENITERKKAEMELKESEQRYRTIIEAFPDILIISDEKGKIVFMNEPAQRITGITHHDFEKPRQKAQIHPEDRYMVAKATKELLSGVKEHSNMIENRFIDAWGNIHWFSGILSKITMNGKLMIQTISRDITEKKQTELELEKHRNHLELLVKERTEELYAINEELKMSNEELTTQREVLENALEHLKQTQKRLIQSEKMASLGVLAAGVAHEINNPLNFINGGIIGFENWLQDNLPERLKEVEPLLHGMNEGIRRASTIVSGLNKYSREDESTFTLCNIGDIIDSCIMMLHYQIKDRIRVIKEYMHEDLTIFANEGRLHQAFLNILSNSVQAIEGEGEIGIKMTVEGESLKILINDSGCGIHEEHITKIMDPFFTTKEPGKGTGLGLSITYNILMQHKGTLDIESTPGKGTQILIKLPLKQAE